MLTYIIDLLLHIATLAIKTPKDPVAEYAVYIGSTNIVFIM